MEMGVIREVDGRMIRGLIESLGMVKVIRADKDLRRGIPQRGCRQDGEGADGVRMEKGERG